MRWARRAKQGDTIIEVMFAITVFAMVAVGSMALMNRGVAITQRALEITQVRQQLNNQAEVLRFVQQEYLAGNSTYQTVWRQLTTSGVAGFAQSQASPYGLDESNRCRSELGSSYHPFILDPKALGGSATNIAHVPILGSTDPTAPPYPQIVYGSGVSAYGMWIESIPKTEANGTRFVDFHIRACWDSVGDNVPVTLGTIVRLYEKN